MAALLLAGNSDGSGSGRGGRRRLWLRRLQYALFVADFLGLIASKEVNVALVGV